MAAPTARVVCDALTLWFVLARLFACGKAFDFSRRLLAVYLAGFSVTYDILANLLPCRLYCGPWCAHAIHKRRKVHTCQSRWEGEYCGTIHTCVGFACTQMPTTLFAGDAIGPRAFYFPGLTALQAQRGARCNRTSRWGRNYHSTFWCACVRACVRVCVCSNSVDGDGRIEFLPRCTA